MNVKKRKIVAFLLLILLLTTAFLRKPAQGYDLDVSRIRQDTVYQCRQIGIRVTGTAEEAKTGEWIAASLEDAGFALDESLLRMPFDGVLDYKSENIIAICNPESGGPLVSIVAHYDSVPTSVGARDNAASVAALMEIARYLGAENPDFPCQIRMVFLGSEENGYHGSAAYVESLTEQDRQRHIAAFNMDISAASDSDEAQLVCNTLGSMVNGTYQEGNFIVPSEGAAAKAIAQAYRSLYHRDLGGVFHFGESDHVSFHNAGLEAVNVCWRKVENAMPVLPESYHKPEDLPEELDYETVRASARCILKAIQILCS